MTRLRLTTQAVGAAIVGALGVFLILEATEIVDGQWRRELADGVERVAFPGWDLWIPGLVGAALAILGVALVAAQIAPPKKGLNTVHEVFKGNNGGTRIRGRAAISAVRHEISQIEGVVDVDARVEKKRVNVEVHVDDRSNIGDIENQARARLNHEFWIDLGLADFALNLLITHHPKPPRVR